MDELILALRTLLEGFWGEFTFTTSEVARQLAFIRSRVSEDETDAEIYFRSVKRLGKFVILAPVPLFAIGIFTSWSPLIATMGLIWALFTVLFATAASPVAIFVASLVEEAKKKNISDGVGAYMLKVKKALYVELTITIFFLAVTTQNNPLAIPSFAVVALFFLVSGAKSKFGEKLLNFTAGVVGIMALWSMLGPQSYSNIQSRLRAIDPFAAQFIGRSPAEPAGGTSKNPTYIAQQTAKYQQEQLQTVQQTQAQQAQTAEQPSSGDAVPMPSLAPVAVYATYQITYPKNFRGGWNLKVDGQWRELRIPDGVNFDIQPHDTIDVVLQDGRTFTALPNNTLLDASGRPVPGFGTLPSTGQGYRVMYLASRAPATAGFSVRPYGS